MSSRDPREERLPKWAQESLKGLRQQLDTAKRLNAELRGEVGETDIHIEFYGELNQPLRKGSRVKFHTGERWDEYVSVHLERGALWLHGGRFLTIHPHVSNAFSVTVGEPGQR